MPGTRRATATASAVSADNSSSVITLKQEKKAAKANTKSVVVDIQPEVDFIKTVGDEDSDETIFSACHSPDCDELDESAGSDLGEYELNYLHNIYQPTNEDILSSHNAPDAILPEAVHPPSLNLHSNIVPPSPAARENKTRSSIQMDEDHEEDSQPSTPPRGNDALWGNDPEEASDEAVVATPPSKPVPVVGKTSGRKRKPVASLDLPSPPPSKRQASERHAAAAAAAIKAEMSDDGDDSDCESRGRPCPMLDGLEIRPEDDPLGLFSRDPATLTPEEQRLLKKQRRLLKNRESAQLSRHRKKMHLHSLEKQVDALKKDKAALAARVQVLQDDNERLRKQLMSAV